MGTLQVETPEREGPLHSHYVSRANNGIYPALSSPAGYEDQHPEDYRPATAREVQKYNAGEEGVVARPLPPIGDSTSASPTSITLQDDADTDEVGPPVVVVTPVVAATDPAPVVVEPAPAAIPPAPAFAAAVTTDAPTE